MSWISHVDEWSISNSMHGPAAMVHATRIAQKRSALKHMRAHSRGLVGDTRRSNVKTPWLWAANSV
eukprot:6968600-Prymnesium_polylepis.1